MIPLYSMNFSVSTIGKYTVRGFKIGQILRSYVDDGDQTDAKDRSRRRYAGILRAGASAVLSKCAVMLVGFLSLPIVVRYLGPVQFGIWATITTSLSLLMVLDLGIANTLTNLISESYAREDNELAGTYASTAFWMMMLVAGALGVIGWWAWPYLNWDRVFNVDASTHEATSKAVAVAYAIFLLGMPAGLATKLLGGYQELPVANIFAAVGSFISLTGVVLVVRLHGGLPFLIGAASGALMLANGACLLWLWLYHKPWLTPWPRKISYSVSRRLLQTGSEFFIIQLTGLVVFNSDNLVIAHFAGPAEVTPYNITWRLVGYASILQTLLLPALWPAYAEAFVRGDIGWVRKTFRRVMTSTMSVAVFFCALFLLAGQFLIRHWAGPLSVPHYSLLFWMCVWVLISTFMNNIACILVAASETRVQAWSSVAAAIINLALSLWLVRTMGSLGVILGTVFSYLLILVGPQVWKTAKILNRPSGTTPHKAMEPATNE